MIRRLAARDVGLWKEIRRAALEEAPLAFGRTLAAFHDQSDDDHRARLATSHTYGAFHGDSITGSASWRALGPSGTVEDHRAGLYSFFVRRERHGQGDADALLARVVRDASAAGILQIELDVVTTNARAVGFYRRAGFEQVGLTPRALRRDDGFADEYRMILRLDA
ncbi:MAG: GNAT family N-acetyltransferase [Maritimibacter sp.]|nr:GNAT family N-acetyltransferase [Maritimibacter sp.]